jgi:hypothetical protein
MCHRYVTETLRIVFFDVFDKKVTITKICSKYPPVLNENTSFGHNYLLRGSHRGLIEESVDITAASLQQTKDSLCSPAKRSGDRRVRLGKIRFPMVF